MNDRNRYRIICSLAILASAQAGSNAQDLSSGGEVPVPAEPVEIGELHIVERAPNKFRIQKTEQQLRREIDAFEAASAQKRKQLERSLIELKRARELAEAHNRNSGAFGMDAGFGASASKWFIGVQVDPISDGVKVRQVLPGMPAGSAGIQEMDTIRSVNGIRVNDASKLNAIINAAGDQELKFQIVRGDEEIEKTLTPAQVDQPQRNQSSGVRGMPAPGFFGGSSSGAGTGFQVVPVEPRAVPSQPGRPPQPRVLELRPNFNTDANPDSAQIDELKRELQELRALVQDVAESLAEGQDDAFELEDDDATEDSDADEAD
jgi:hypothetical protein